MKVEELIDLIYSRKKDNTLSHHAKKFIEKYSLDIDKELNNQEIMEIIIKVSSLEKREILLKKILENKSQDVDNNIDLREVTYKQACKHYHPDNTDTGNATMFKFIQEIKFHLWEWDGSPVKEIRFKNDWRYDEKYSKMSEEEEINEFRGL